MSSQQSDPFASRHGLVGRHNKAERAVPVASMEAPRLAGRAAAADPMVLTRLASVIGGARGDGFFDRMFPTLPPLIAVDDDLARLAAAMTDADPSDAAGDNPAIPAGFTYLGQFIDHDITLDLMPLSARVDDPLMLRNFRTPGLDLDSVYGAGLGPYRFLFRQDEPKFLIGMTSPSPDLNGPPLQALPNDLERTRHGRALIADHRNDENLVVAQTHLAFLKFHNRVVDQLRAEGVSSDVLFDETVRTVRWHYQWLVLHDFVERLTEPGIVATIRREGRKFYRFRTVPYMPLEFAGAAYRLGHSMVREVYSYNRIFRPTPPTLAPATLRLLFQFTSLSGGIHGELPGADSPTVPSNWVIDWRRFFEFNTPPAPGFELNSSRKLDPFIAPALHRLPGFLPGREADLAFRNLRRGVLLGLPSGQDVAALMAAKMGFTPLTTAEIASGPDGGVAASLGFDTATPLWYYILKEAQVKGSGQRLGPVGARIVAEVFVGLVQGDRDSFMSDPPWTPTLPSAVPGTFTMTDLLRFVGDISPLDGITTV